MTRWILGNLDAETELARAAGPGAVRALPAAVLRRLAAAATLLAAFAREGDVLWTPVPVDPGRRPRLPELPAPRLVSGALPADGERLPWCVTPSVPAGPRAAQGGASSGRLADRVWALPRGTAEATAHVNNRRFVHELAREWDLALPGARLVEDAAALAGTLAALGAGGARWVVKPPHSAAGRGLVLGRGPAPDAPTSARLSALLAAHGELLVEPWLERTLDLGLCGFVDATGVSCLPAHVQQIDAAGRFGGVTVACGEAGGAALALDADGLPDGTPGRLTEVGAAVGQRLLRAGYRGPFALDAWVARGPGGEPWLHPLGEVNARLSFGLVAAALAQRLGAPRGWPALALCFSSQPPPAAADTLPLLAGRDDEPTWAWVERRPGPSS